MFEKNPIIAIALQSQMAKPTKTNMKTELTIHVKILYCKSIDLLPLKLFDTTVILKTEIPCQRYSQN